MKTLFLVIILASLSVQGFCQKTKSFDVCKTKLFHIYGRSTFKDNVQVDTSYHAIGFDSRYTQLINYISLHDAIKLKELYEFFKYCGDFLQKEEVGISDTYMGNNITVGRLMGMKYINIYGIGTDNNGYTQFAGIQIKNVLTGIEYFAKKHKIALE